MSNSFSDYLFDQDFIRSRSIIMSNDARSRLMYVENELDISFWKKILGIELSNIYEFNTSYDGPGSSETSARGKFRFEKFYEKANLYAVFAVDSDFDHLTPNKSNRHQHLLTNPFILHTYGYNKESLTNCLENLTHCLDEFYYTERADIDIRYFFEQYSNCIKDFLIKYICLVNKGTAPYDEKVFHSKIIPNEGFIKEVLHDKQWQEFQNSMNDMSNELEPLLEDCNLEDTKELFLKHGLEENNAYLFMNGHKLQKNVVAIVIKEVKHYLRTKEIEKIKQNGFSGKRLGDKMLEIDNHFKENCKFEVIRYTSDKFLNDDFMNRIKEQLAPITN